MRARWSREASATSAAVNESPATNSRPCRRRERAASARSNASLGTGPRICATTSGSSVDSENSSHSSGRRFLAPVLASLLAEHPGLEVELVLADRRVDLVEAGFDCAIHLGALEDSTLVARRLGEVTTVMVASPKYLATLGRVTAATLRSARCIGFAPIETWRLEGASVRVEPVLSVNDLEVACEAALAGVGIARLPEVLCREALKDGRLRPVLGERSTLKRPVHVVYPHRDHLPTKVRVFIDALAAHLAPSRRGSRA